MLISILSYFVNEFLIMSFKQHIIIIQVILIPTVTTQIISTTSNLNSSPDFHTLAHLGHSCIFNLHLGIS